MTYLNSLYDEVVHWKPNLSSVFHIMEEQAQPLLKHLVGILMLLALLLPLSSSQWKLLLLCQSCFCKSHLAADQSLKTTQPAYLEDYICRNIVIW